MQIKVFFFSNGVVKRLVFEQAFPNDPQRIPSIQGRLIPVECDPSLWKCAVVEQVHLDCATRKISCFFIDGSVQSFPMAQACYARIITSVSKMEAPTTATNTSASTLLANLLSGAAQTSNPFFSFASSGAMEAGAASVPTLVESKSSPQPLPIPRHKQLTQGQILARVRSDILNTFQRFVISELKLPQNSALWSAESTLSKLERKVDELDQALDQKTKAILEKKQSLKQLRSSFFTATEKEEKLLPCCSGVFLECVLEGVELDIADTNKELALLQSSVERIKVRAALVPTPPPSPPSSGAFLRLDEPSQEITPTSSSPVSTPLSRHSDPDLQSLAESILTQGLASEEELTRAREERDHHFVRVTKLLEMREQIKSQLRHQYRSNMGSATESRKQGGSRSFTPESEHLYIALFRQLKDLRETRDSLSEEKITVANARENSKMEIRNIHESLAYYRQRVEEEKNRKRKARKQSHAARAARHHQAAQTIPV